MVVIQLLFDFTLNENYNYEENIVACDSYDWNGQVLNEGDFYLEANSLWM